MLDKVLIQLALAAGIGPVLVARLCSAHDPALLVNLSRLSADEIVQQYGIVYRQAALIKAALADEAAYQEHQAWCAAHAVTPVLITDQAYPELLRHVGSPPIVLWVKGSVAALSKPSACALVGSREATLYGKRVVKMLVSSLVDHGIVTISGGARGIDASVHEETIKASGCTVAVMGCGLAHTYPREHEALFAAIVAAEGALVSPFPPHTQPKPGLFPVRNRIIAGLSHACIVVQAAAKSGALITAVCAAEENREVGAVPGPIDELVSVGVNDLLAQGARVIMDGASAVELCGKPVRRNEKQVKIENKQKSDGEPEILSLLEHPCALEDLVAVSGKSLKELQEQLFVLQLDGVVCQDHAGLWVRVI